jgi:hypothetical protein
MEIFKQLQVIFHCCQSVCKPLWLLLKQGEASLHGFGNDFTNCNSSSSFSAREAIYPINVSVWYKYISHISLRSGPHLNVALAVAYYIHSAASQSYSH